VLIFRGCPFGAINKGVKLRKREAVWVGGDPPFHFKCPNFDPSSGKMGSFSGFLLSYPIFSAKTPHSRKTA
jgi:hypothetical protein